MDKDTKHTLARLADVLDTFGPDAARWPEGERDELRSFARTHPEGRLLLREAQALTRVMDVAPGLTASAGLKSRIISVAVRDGTRESRVVPMASPRKHAPDPAKTGRLATFWPAAALAASFALGLYLGVSGIGGRVLDGTLQFASISGSASDGETVSWLDGGDPEGLL